MFQRGRNEAVKKSLRCWGVGVLLGVVVLGGRTARWRRGPRVSDADGKIPDGSKMANRSSGWATRRGTLLQIPNREDAELYLATRAEQGFTVIQAAIVMGEERAGRYGSSQRLWRYRVRRESGPAALDAGQWPERC